MSTRAVFVPFDLFGSPGASAGTNLLADAFAEMLEDNLREVRPTRSRAYQDHVQIEELEFETLTQVRDWLDRARRVARSALRSGEFLLWVGGNHATVLPVLEELGRRRNTIVVQLDAHLDIYNLADCTEEFSHGNFLLHATRPLPPIIHVGHRDLFLTPEAIGEHFQAVLSAERIALAPEAAVQELTARTADATRVWIDIDCDVIDPAYFPAVAGPLPFGLAPPLLLRLLDAVWSNRVAGVSISEFVPARDDRDRSLELLMWLMEWILLKKYEAPRSPQDEEE